MTRRLRVIAAACAAACASGRAGGGSAAPTQQVAPAAPTVAVPPPTVAAPLGTPPAPPSEAIRYGPSALRYLVHRRLHIQQALGDQPQAQDLGARIYLAATITGPADSIGYPATFLVDSIVPDSGMPQPVAGSVSRARRLIFSGRVVARGEFVNAVASDSTLAQSLVQLLANFRDFLPRMPANGLTPGADWTDTLEATQKGSGAEFTRRSIVHATAAAWEDHAGARSLRLQSSASYGVTGSGTSGGQGFVVSGAGGATMVAFIAADGRYLGGESRDSTALTFHLREQGVAIPVIQVARTTVTVLP